MKINFMKHLKKESLLSHIILNGITDILKNNKKIILNEQYKENNILDIILTVNGIEIDIEKFCDMWQKQIEDKQKEFIKKYIKEKYENTFDEIDNLLYDLITRIESEIDNRLEDWEK